MFLPAALRYCYLYLILCTSTAPVGFEHALIHCSGASQALHWVIAGRHIDIMLCSVLLISLLSRPLAHFALTLFNHFNHFDSQKVTEWQTKLSTLDAPLEIFVACNVATVAGFGSTWLSFHARIWNCCASVLLVVFQFSYFTVSQPDCEKVSHEPYSVSKHGLFLQVSDIYCQAPIAPSPL